MKRIKLIITVALLSLLGTIQLNAQKAEKIKERLNLTDQQVEQYESVRLKYKPELKAIKENESLSKEEKKELKKEVKSRKNEEIKSFLSADQYTELEAIRKERKAKKKGKKKKKD